MTTAEQQSPEPDPAEAYAADYRRLWDTAVATLTAAVQLDHPQHGPADFPGFLASALGAVAANVGGAHRITAGRPGSWESAALRQLVEGTVGYDLSAVELVRGRTIPVLVHLNVAQLVDEAYQDAPDEQREAMLLPFDDAAQVLYRADEEWRVQHPAPAEGAPDEDWEAYEARIEQEQAAEDALRARYAATFEAYAETFTAAVLDEARAIDGLAVELVVEVNTDPEATWWDDATVKGNPVDADCSDPLAWHLWAAARDRLGLPHALVEIPAKAED